MSDSNHELNITMKMCLTKDTLDSLNIDVLLNALNQALVKTLSDITTEAKFSDGSGLVTSEFIEGERLYQAGVVTTSGIQRNWKMRTTVDILV